MTFSKLQIVVLIIASTAVSGAAIIAYVAPAPTEKPAYVVSQKDRKFSVTNIDIARGDSIRIVNDDGTLRHHAYIESESFHFDSGDQEPGGRADIKFTHTGTFYVLCGIHPKMKLIVHVE